MTDRPREGAANADDVLSSVLGAVRLSGAVFFDFDLTSPWVAEAPPASEIVSRVMPGAQRVINFHLVARGSCWSSTFDEDPRLLEEGDIIVYPQGDAHALSSEPGMRTKPDLRTYARPQTPLPIVQTLGGSGPQKGRIICCFLGCDERPYNPLLSALPRVIHLKPKPGPVKSDLFRLVTMASEESGSRRAGSENILARLSELMFVAAVREYLEALPPEQSGWLAGLRDPVVGRALASLHTDPTANWTVETLAHSSGLSRSAFAERFTALTGLPPMQYLAMWRMQLASGLLLSGRSIGDAASAVGYESEAAFSRAFKKLVGLPPAKWRGNERGSRLPPG